MTIKYWVVATYKINESGNLQRNLESQEFMYYLPKIITKDSNIGSKEEMLFPGYIFVNIALENYSSLKFTRGIKNIIKFGENISHITDNEIKKIRTIEEESIINPVTTKICIGQEVFIANGPLKGTLVKISSLPYKKRVDIFLSILGSSRRVNIQVKDISI